MGDFTLSFVKQVALNENRITSVESSAVRKVWDKQEHKFKAKKACFVRVDLFDFESMKEKVFCVKYYLERKILLEYILIMLIKEAKGYF